MSGSGKSNIYKWARAYSIRRWGRGRRLGADLTMQAADQ